MSRARELARLGNTNAISIDTSNNVGLGTTTSIQYKLDVVGDANFVGVVTATSFGGDGSNLTGVAATDNINTDNIAISGIFTGGTNNTFPAEVVITAGGLEVDGGGLDIAGVSTLAGITKVTNTTASTSTSTGALVVSGGVGIAGSLHVGENVSVGGTLTYEDVTNIDSVGLITARAGVNISGGELLVGAAFTVGQAGVVTATSYYGDGSTLTNAGITAGKAMGLSAFLS